MGGSSGNTILKSGDGSLSGQVLISSGSSSSGTSGDIIVESGNSVKAGDVTIRVRGKQSRSDESGSHGLELDGGYNAYLHGKSVKIANDAAGGAVFLSSSTYCSRRISIAVLMDDDVLEWNLMFDDILYGKYLSLKWPECINFCRTLHLDEGSVIYYKQKCFVVQHP